MLKKIAFLLLFISTHYIILSQNNPEKPTLVVGIVVEQMRYDFIYKYWDKLGDSGFKKIINQGTYCQNTHYEYLNINSASGYATIACGSYPSQHGIIYSQWFDRIQRKEIYCIEDKNVKPVATNFESGKSPKNLSSTTWTDQLRIASYKMSKVYTVGFNDYASVLTGGKLANTAFWFDENTGRWVTSSYYIDSLEEWTKSFNEKEFPDVYLGRTWNTTLPMNKYTESLSDATSYEKGIGGQNTFPYDLTVLKSKFSNYSILKYTPFSNSLTKDFAINLIMSQYLGKDPYTDVIYINFAATSYIADVFGIQSVEFEDAIIKLDKDIAHLLAAVDDYVGIENTLFFVTSDMGACENKQWLEDINIETGFFNFKRTNVVLNSYIRAIYGMGNWIEGFYNNEIYFNHFDIDKQNISLSEFQQKAAQMFANFTGVTTVVATESVMKGTFSEGIMKQAQNSYFQERSGDLFVVLDFGWRFEYTEPQGLCDCNSAYNENSHVPLILYGWKIPQQKILRKISADDLAVTLSFLLNIPLPSKSTGDPIVEVF